MPASRCSATPARPAATAPTSCCTGAMPICRATRAAPSARRDGVRVYSLRDPRRPRRIATFGRIPGTWTEKTIVQRVATPSFTGDLAVTSVQSCRDGAFRGFALYDVTRPAPAARARPRPHRPARLARDLAPAGGPARLRLHGDHRVRDPLLLERDARGAGLPHLRRHAADAARPPRRLGSLGGARPRPVPRPEQAARRELRALGRRRRQRGRTSPTGISARSSSTCATRRARATSAARARPTTRTRPGSGRAAC